MPIYYLLLCGIFLPFIFGVTELGFKNYTKYEPGDMNLILIASHGGLLNPSRQSNGEEWPDRKNGCEGSDGQCIWTHTCGATSTKCCAMGNGDWNTAKLAQDIADGMKAITGELDQVRIIHLAMNRVENPTISGNIITLDCLPSGPHNVAFAITSL